MLSGYRKLLQDRGISLSPVEFEMTTVGAGAAESHSVSELRSDLLCPAASFVS